MCAGKTQQLCLQHQRHVGLLELRTFLSWHIDTDCFSLALSPVERIVSYSHGQHGQLSMSIFFSVVLHL